MPALGTGLAHGERFSPEEERHRNAEFIPRGMTLLLWGCFNLFSFVSISEQRAQLVFVSITTSQTDKRSLEERFLLGNLNRTQLSWHQHTMVLTKAKDWKGNLLFPRQSGFKNCLGSVSGQKRVERVLNALLPSQ